MFNSARRKLERAKKHVRDFETELTKFIATKPHRFSVYSDAKTGELGLRIRILREPPDTLALIMGDAFHNMRIALDHALFELIEGDSGQANKIKFPFGKDRESYEGFCRGYRTPSKWIVDWLLAVEAFPGGKGEALFALNELCNVDKHVMIAPTVRATSHPPLTILDPDGRLLYRMEDNVFMGPLEAFTVGVFPRGCSVELDDDTNCPANIFLLRGNDPPWSVGEACGIFLNGVEAAIDLAAKMKPVYGILGPLDLS